MGDELIKRAVIMATEHIVDSVMPRVGEVVEVVSRIMLRRSCALFTQT